MLAISRFNAEAAERVGEIFQGVVEFIADVADTEAGALADLIVFEAVPVFEGNKGAVIFVELGDEQLQGSDGFEFSEDLFGAGIRAFPFAVGVHGSFPLMVAEMTESEIADAAEKPGARVDHFLPMRMKLEEGVLDEIFRGFALADQAMGKSEQWRFFRDKHLPE